MYKMLITVTYCLKTTLSDVMLICPAVTGPADHALILQVASSPLCSVLAPSSCRRGRGLFRPFTRSTIEPNRGRLVGRLVFGFHSNASFASPSSGMWVGCLLILPIYFLLFLLRHYPFWCTALQIFLMTFLSKICSFSFSLLVSRKFPSRTKLLGKSLCWCASSWCLPVLILSLSLSELSTCTSTQLLSSPWCPSGGRCRCWTRIPGTWTGLYS